MMFAPVKIFMVLTLPLGLSACASQTDAQRLIAAENNCFDRSYNFVSPRGSVGFGVGSKGSFAGLDLSITPDPLQKRDPEQLYKNCVIKKAGLLPSQGQYSRSDWRGQFHGTIHLT
ncbi:MAG: hypothetical protein QMC17_09265 [Paracoccaceae bacterium]|jgi:hypothetical protein